MTDNTTQTFSSFDEMDLKKSILRGIYAYGFEKPSAIQQRAIIPFTTGRDIIAQAQSGTGKTGTFSIGVLQMIDEDVKGTQAIILSPTRELARQTYNVIKGLSQYTKITIKEVIGGLRKFEGNSGSRFDRNNRNSQKDEDNTTEHIVVGTPGKVLDDLVKGRIDNKNLKIFVLDEADEMLSKGFSEQIENIFRYLSRNVQIGLFSATLPNEILKLTEEFMNDPFKILVKTDELTLEGLKQYYVDIGEERNKYETLCDLYGTFMVTQSIIYCNTKKKVHNLTSKMRDNNFMVSCLYGDMPQLERNKIMESFRSGETRVLITTDVLARGIDIQQISLVINYDLPLEVETYLHRIGRTSRYGKKGLAISLVTNQDYDLLKRIEKYYATQINELPSDIDKLIGNL